MIDLYAVQFEAAESTSPAAHAQLRAVIELVQQWIETAYKRHFGGPLTLPDDDYALDLQQGRFISRTTEQTENLLCSVSRFTFTYPDRKDGNLIWTARICVARYAELLDFSMRIGIDSSQFVVAPVELNVGRPQLIPSLLHAYQWSLGGTRVSDSAVQISAQDVRQLATRLMSPERRLPVIIVSKAAQDDTPLVDSSDIANQLAGIAEVYELSDKWASFKLTSVIGRAQACYNGAVRIYWPRGAKTLDGFNQVILPDESARAQPKEIRKRLFKELSPISALRFIDGPITIDAIEALHAERIEKLQKEKEDARAAGDTEELIAIAEEEVRDLRANNEQLQKEVEQLRRERSLLMTDLRTTQDNLKAVWIPPSEVSSGLSLLDHADAVPETVKMAVQEASELYCDTLVFHQKAFSSAEDSPYQTPEDVKHALLAMHEVCLLLRESRMKRNAIGRLEDQFSERGFTYRAHESETSMTGKKGDERKLLYQGKKVPIEKHLALGKGGPDSCLRIYFYDDEDTNRFVIGHVGRHKANTRT